MNHNIRFLIFIFLIFAISCSDDPEVTCIDGIQNGTETGIDCGGDCEACSSCTDGMQNGNETGVDCGGDCEECPLSTRLLGTWQQLTHTIDGNDARAFYETDDIFYSFGDNNVFEGINVARNETYKVSLDGMYVADDINKLRITNVFSVEHNYEIAGDQLTVIALNTGEEDIQTFQRVEVDLCDGVSCGSMACRYGYCF